MSPTTEVQVMGEAVARVLEDLELIRPEVEAVPDHGELDHELLLRVVAVSRRIQKLKDSVDAMRAEAEVDELSEDTVERLRELGRRLYEAQVWFQQQYLPSGLND